MNIKTKWDLTPLFKNEHDPKIEKNLKATEQAILKFSHTWKKRSDYLTNVSVLKKALDEYEGLMRSFGLTGGVEHYFWLRLKIDSANSVLKAKSAKISDFENKMRDELNFFELNLAKISKQNQKLFLKNETLLPYKHFLEKIFKTAQFNLSEKEEKIMAMKQSPAHMYWTRLTSELLSKEEPIVEGKKRTFSELFSLLENKDKKIRDEAAKELNAILKKLEDIGEAEINAILQNKKINDELRGYKRPDESRHCADDIESKTVDALLDAVISRFDIPKRFYVLKAKLLKLKKLEYHERNIPYGGIDKTYSFPDTVKTILDILKTIDEEFYQIFQKFLAEGNIDAFPKKGKRDGAFCAYDLLSTPSYIMLNHTGKINDVLTLAHEFGHGLNNELIKKKQNALNFGTPMSTAETASTFLESVVLSQLLKDADDELRLALLIQKLNDDVSTIFRQVACYKFEQELHEEFRKKGFLKKEEIGNIFQKHMKSYMGNAVIQSGGAENWWIYWSHIRYFFYVYSYASGLLISKSLEHSYRKNPEFIQKIKEFLSTGLALSPEDIFKKLSINIAQKSFWENGLQEIEKELKEAERLAKKLKKI